MTKAVLSTHLDRCRFAVGMRRMNTSLGATPLVGTVACVRCVYRDDPAPAPVSSESAAFPNWLLAVAGVVDGN